MNAESFLNIIAKAMDKCRLEAVLIGNAAAALQGAPVTTLDFDFMFRKTSANMKKLKKLADDLDMSMEQPHYPVSGLYRLVNEKTGLQLDFMSTIHGVRSLEGLRSRSCEIKFGGHALWVADLSDIIKSKKAADRQQDRAVLDVLEKTRSEKANRKNQS